MTVAAGKKASSIQRRRISAREAGSPKWLEQRAKILAAAAEAFRFKGRNAVTMEDIASRFEGDRATIYYYFGDKNELFFAVIEDAVRHIAATNETIAAADAPAAVRLRRIIEAVADAHEAQYPYLDLYIQEDMRRLPDSITKHAGELRELGTQYMATLKRVIDEGIAGGEFRPGMDAEMLMHAVHGALCWTHRWFTPGGAVTGAGIGQAFADIFLLGACIDHRDIGQSSEPRPASAGV